MMQHSISPQYITKDKINVTILDVIDPAHFVVKESPDLLNAASEAKKFLEAEAAMQKYYASVEPCFFQLPLKDAIIVVLHKEIFYRAKVIRILTLSAGHLFRVYLVDYGVECSVPRENIYEIEKDFLRHPFQAVNIKLLGIEPVSLVMDQINLNMSYGPVSDWDPPASNYIKEIQKSMCSAYMEVQATDQLHVYGRLYFCFENCPTICINDHLVSRSFAHFNENCWKKVKKIGNIDEDPHIKSYTAADQFDVLGNVNPEQVPSTSNLSNTEFDFGNIKMNFINPSDGKIIGESTLTSKSEKISVDEMPKLQNELIPPKEVVPDIDKIESQQPAHAEVTATKTEGLSLSQKQFQKLLNKKKSKSPIKCDRTDNVSIQNLPTASVNNTSRIPSISCENSKSNISSTKELSLCSKNNMDDNRTTNSYVNEEKRNFNFSNSAKFDSSSSIRNVESCKNILNGDISLNESPKPCFSDESKGTVSRVEERAKHTDMSQDRLIAERTLLRLNRKSVSPGKVLQSPSSVDHGVRNTPVSKSIPFNSCTDKEKYVTSGEEKIVKDDSPNKLEILKDRLNESFPNEYCQTKLAEESVQVTSNIPLRQENGSSNMKQFQKLQRKAKRKESLQGSKELSSGFDLKNLELTVNTSCGSSLCDSDSGLNSLSSPSISDKI